MPYLEIRRDIFIMEIDQLFGEFDDVIIVVPLPKYLVFYELGLALSQALTSISVTNHIEVQLINDYCFSQKQDSRKIYIIYGVDCFDINQLPEKFIVYQFEQMWAKINTVPEEVIQAYIQIIQRSVALWEYSHSNIKFFQDRHVTVPIYHVPLGYSPCLEYNNVSGGIDLTSVEGGTVGFIGNIKCERRKRILEPLQNKKKLTIFNNNVWNNNDPRVGQTTRLKAEIFHGLEIGVVVYYYNPVVSSFDLYRIITFIANRCVVISEYCMDLSIIKKFSPYIVFCESFEIEAWIDYFNSNPEDRKARAEKAYQWLVRENVYRDLLPNF